MEGFSNAPASFELSEYGALLRRRWRTVVAGILAGLALAGGCLLFLPKTYTATTSLLVTPTGVEDTTSTSGQTQEEINLDTEAQIAQSLIVADKATRALHTGLPPEELLEHLTVAVPPNSSVLDISYAGSTPASAQQGAQAFARAYLSNRRETAKAAVQGQAKALKKRAKALTGQLESVTDQLAVLPEGSSDRSYAQAQQDLLTQQISSLNSQISALSAGKITPGRVISAARMPTMPSSPLLPLYLPSGLMAGLLLGLLAAVVWDHADNRIRRAGDVERLLRLPVLLDIPPKRQPEEPELLPARSPLGQAFHELCHALTAMLGHGNHVVLVTGASGGPESGMTAANLAAALARTGSHVVLVCADLQGSAVPQMLGVRSAPGLSDILVHGAHVSRVIQAPTAIPQLRVVAPGLPDDRASDQLQTQAMDALVAELRGSATYVVLEAPSTSASADAQALADVSDAAIMVVEVPRAGRTQVQEGVRQLDRMGAAVLGAAVLPAAGEQRSSWRRPRKEKAQVTGAASSHTAPLAAVLDASRRPHTSDGRSRHAATGRSDVVTRR